MVQQWRRSLKICHRPQIAFLFIRGHCKGVTNPRHLGGAQVSILFIVPLWETTPAIKQSRQSVSVPQHQLRDTTWPAQKGLISFTNWCSLTCSRSWKYVWAWSCCPRRAPCSNVMWGHWRGCLQQLHRHDPRTCPPERTLPLAGLLPTFW